MKFVERQYGNWGVYFNHDGERGFVHTGDEIGPKAGMRRMRFRSERTAQRYAKELSRLWGPKGPRYVARRIP
jgi:hypothetical protein